MNNDTSNLNKYPYYTEEHDYGDAFWIQPVTLKPLHCYYIRMSDVIEIDDEIWMKKEAAINEEGT